MSTIAVEARPPLWRKLVGFNLLTGIVLGSSPGCETPFSVIAALDRPAAPPSGSMCSHPPRALRMLNSHPAQSARRG